MTVLYKHVPLFILYPDEEIKQDRLALLPLLDLSILVSLYVYNKPFQLFHKIELLIIAYILFFMASLTLLDDSKDINACLAAYNAYIYFAKSVFD